MISFTASIVLVRAQKTRAFTLLAVVPTTISLTVGLGAGTAAAQTASAPAPAEQGVGHYDGIFDDIDVPRHLRGQIDAAVGSLGVAIPWHLLDGIDDDWDDCDDWDDDDGDDRWDD